MRCVVSHWPIHLLLNQNRQSTQWAGRVLGGPTAPLVILCYPLLRNGMNVRQANMAKVSVFWEVKLLLFCSTEALSKVKA